jgi:DNA invertase Pin-like site-specific DNA recombinase
MVKWAYSYMRFSSSEQRKGNSFERQIRGRDDYVARKGLTLDAEFVIQDAAVSAFRGVNAATGALRVFLDACERRRIRPGSYLIVENLDRLSRDEILDAVMLFLGILKHGVTLVTVFPEQEFSKENLDMARLVLAVAELARGHGESVAKSERSHSNWEKRRRNIANEVLTARKPSWLDLKDGEFVLDAAKAATVRRIFQMAVDGHGIGSIAKRFNRESVPTISKAKHWHDSYVYKVLTNRACIGEFQPRVLKIENVERAGRPARKMKTFQPVGPPLKDYFPAVVKDEVFFRTQQAMKLRCRTGGRICNGVNNLFTGLVVGTDGTTYSLRPRNSHNYLVRATVTAGLVKDVPAVPYLPFERAMLKWLREVTIDLDERGVDVQGLQARKEDLEGRIGTLVDEMRAGKNLKRAAVLLDEWETELEQVTQELEQAVVPRRNQLGHAQNLLALLDNAEETSREPLRLQIKQQLKLLVKQIMVEVEGKVRTKNKKVHCTIEFKNGVKRRIWFQTGKDEVTNGLWSPDGRVPIDDMLQFLASSAESDPT